MTSSVHGPDMRRSPPRIAFLTSTFRDTAGDSSLIDDLVNQLVSCGAELDVFVNDIQHPVDFRIDERLDRRIINMGRRSARPSQSRIPGIVRRVFWATMGRVRARRLVSPAGYDLCIYFGPAFLDLGMANWLRKTSRAPTLVHFLWDFFPVHQIEIGRLRRGPHNILLKKLEAQGIKRADVVVLMTKRNAEFFRDYYPDLDPRILVHPPWASDPPLPVREGDKFPSFSIVFGGQLVKGRGVEHLIDALAVLEQRGRELDLLIVGEGPDRERLRAQVARVGVSRVQFVDRMPRADYLALLQRAHCGVAITVPGVSIPSFPSKIVDYCLMGVPVVVALEDSTDAGELVVESGAGLLVTVGSPNHLADAIESLLLEHQRGQLHLRAEAARRLYDSSFDVSTVANLVLGSVEGQ
ncbi:MAG: glycosyltransferase family 4 protein [Cryobacterium sp.]|nr:glycosyltransferase family 4 protein [Cryobacterium sp.]